MASQQQSAEKLFLAALDLEPAERPVFLDRACANAPGLRRVVEELLLEDQRAGSFLNKPLFDPVDSALTTEILPVSNGSRYPSPPIAPRFGPGELIAGRFTVTRFIDRGGMGEVYEVEDRFLQGTHVALKMILPEIAADAEASHRFEQEVLLARKVTHPNLCPIYDIFRSQDPPPPFLFLTMKLLSGETLGARLRNGKPISSEEAIAIFRQLVSGIAAIHAAGVIHRDIKPNNVMLDHSGPRLCVSVMDFGLARLHESDATVLRPGTVAGTPGYLAPELLGGHSPSQATDLFALGVLLHQVLTGKRPIETAAQAASPAPSLAIANLPSLYTQTVRELLSTDPQRRCRAFEHIHTTLDSRASHSPIHPAPRLWTRRNFAIASAATAAAAVGGVAWKRDGLYDLLHPLPQKRFVALLGWPPSTDSRLKPMLMGLIDAMANELARAEAFDHDLFVIAQRTATDMTSLDQLNETRESLGANLVLATSAIPAAHDLHVSFQVLDPNSPHPLRTRTLQVPVDQQLSLPEKAVRTAASLLDITHYQPDDKRTKVGTRSPEALASFQTAEALRAQENEAGLDASIEKYKQALELDPNYALSAAKLALAYLRSYSLHANTAALSLARGNCALALALNPNLLEAHFASAFIKYWTGDKLGSIAEMSKALSLDPANPRALLYQAQFLTHCNRWQEAEETFSRLLVARPNFWLAHQELGILYDAEGKYGNAVAEFSTASLASPKSTLPLTNLSELHLKTGHPEKALEVAGKSFALVPNDGAASSMASSFRCIGKVDESIAYASKAVELNPDDPENWLVLADSLALSRSRRSDALSALEHLRNRQEEALTVDPADGPGWLLLALAQAKLGEADKSNASLKKADLLYSKDMDSQLTKARTLEVLGRREDSIGILSDCVRRGVTHYQLENIPDMQLMREDPRYHELLIASAATKASQV